ncbi:MAG: response regulator [Calditrichaceae bacterium]|jgi:DNA-binding response OmpR family regulator
MNEKAKILAIDDEQVIIESMVRLLSAEGLKVDTTLSTQEALTKIDHNKYQLIVTDLMMPDVDGFQLLDELHKRNLHIPIIVMTGYSTVENAVKSLHEGAIDFLPKPFTVDELLSCVQRGLNYGKILGLDASDSSINEVDYVNCPVSYYRLGYNTWASLQNDGAIRVGVTDLFLKTIQSIKHIELQQIDHEVIQGNMCAQVETNASLVHNILTPVSGRIINKNTKIEEQTSLVEKDPYFEGWFYTIIPSDLDYELKHLIHCSSDR